MGKKKVKKEVPRATTDEQQSENPEQSSSVHDLKDAQIELLDDTHKKIERGEGISEKNKGSKKKGKKKDDWEDFDMEEALLEVEEDKPEDEKSDKREGRKGKLEKRKETTSEGLREMSNEDQDVNEIVVKIETVKPEKKEQDKKVSKKGKKGRKNNDWEDFDMEEALLEVVQDKPGDEKSDGREGRKGKVEKRKETTSEKSSPAEFPLEVARETVTKDTPTTEPVAKDTPTTEPVTKAIPTTEPVAKATPTTEPVAKATPTTEPVAKATPTTEPVTKDTPTTEPLPPFSVGDSKATEIDVDVEEREEEDKKKKKKKKKAPNEKDDKKSKKSTVGSAIKKRLEAVRAAQKAREEEERKRIEAEEEAERKRLEELRHEEEKKQRKKQKEKERIERLKKEGKYLTKSEKEKKAKQKASLEALKAQGIEIPGLKQSLEGDRKPVRYGSRVRPKKKESPSIQTATDDTENTHCKDAEFHSTSEEQVFSDPVKESSDVVDDWEALNESEDDVEKDIGYRQDGSANGSENESELHSSEKAPADVHLSLVGKIPPEMGEIEKHDVFDDNTSSEEVSDDEPDELFRSPVVCVLGHVDTGKTKILDKIRRTNVQDGEAGGITQQIGATFVPQHAVKEQTKHLKDFSRQELKIPGLLIIDTPGHESFSNLRTRGSSLCDIAILVVDIMHGLEPQTIESINILKRGKVPFIIALNKVDRLLDWKRSPSSGIRDNLKRQKATSSSQFEELYKQVLVQFAEQELNIALFWDKVNFKEYVPVCPTSAISGDGMGDLIALLVTVCQRHLLEELHFSEDLECHVLEVKAISGLGMTIDVILRNGFLKEGDTVVLCGVDGPFTTQLRALLTPQPLRELRVKNAYIQHKMLAGAQGVKLTGKELEKTLAGTPLFVASNPDEVELLKDKAQATLTATLNAVKCQDIGVYVQASTLGSLEALVEFLKQSKIPYFGVNIGPVHKKDVMKASVMLEHKNDYAVILAFDVRIEREAQDLADNLGVRIFSADIIYHLFDNFMKYREELRQRMREQYKDIAIFPCKVKILPNCIFKTRDPIVVGVKVEGGIVKVGTPLTVPSKNFCDIGIVTSMEVNHKPVDLVRKGAEVCLKIESMPGETPRLLGRHFDEADLIVSKISRQSIDAVKEYFRDDLQKNDWQLMIDLKKQFQIL